VLAYLGSSGAFDAGLPWEALVADVRRQVAAHGAGHISSAPLLDAREALRYMHDTLDRRA
jgi:hypothetical protein